MKWMFSKTGFRSESVIFFISILFWANLLQAKEQIVKSDSKPDTESIGLTPKNWPWRGVTLDFRTQPADLDRLTRLVPLNSIRLTLKAHQLAVRQKRLSPQEAFAQDLQWAEQMLDKCKTLDLVAVITINRFPLDSRKPFHQRELFFWEQPENPAEVVDTAALLAKRFSGRGDELAAYEFIGEPIAKLGRLKFSPPGWRGLQEKIIKTVQQHDPGRWLVMTPGYGGDDDNVFEAYENFKPFSAEARVVYGAHMYKPLAYTHQGLRNGIAPFGTEYPGTIKGVEWDKGKLAETMMPLRRFQKKYNVFVWIGEFSAIRWAPNSSRYLLDLAELFEEYQWGWAYHSYNASKGWSPDYSTQFAQSQEEQKNHYQGDRSERWQTLRKIFSKNTSKLPEKK